MFQGFVERGFSNTEDQTARFAALLGHQPGTYSSFAEELAKEWASLEDPHITQRSAVFHPISTADKTAMAAMRAIVEPNNGLLRGTAARVPFDGIMEHVAVPEGVTFEAGTVGGVSGWWCKPEGAQPDSVIFHIHGGWFNWGSAKAYRNLVGHLAVHAGAFAFSPDYRLAPEHPFPAALEDVRASYAGLVELGYKKIAVTGDSAGGALALGLLLSLKSSQLKHQVVPIAGVALSPVTDLSLSGTSWTTRAAADPYFTKVQAAELVRSYLNGADPKKPDASPLHADLTGLPPIRVHVGDDEVLLDDSVRFVNRALAAGVDAHLDVWEGMAHVFPGSVGQLSASTLALQRIGSFLSECFKKITPIGAEIKMQSDIRRYI
jgi:acetyl esterase/lipase